MSNFRTLHPRVADSILTVENLAELALIGDPQEGDIRYVKDGDALYTFNGVSWSLSDTGVAGPSPAVSTDNAIVRWDGVDASTIQSSPVIIDDDGRITGVASIQTGLLSAPGDSLIVDTDLLLRNNKRLQLAGNNPTIPISITVPTVITQSRSPQIPDDTGNFVLTTATQTLTGKTFNADGAGNSITNIENADIKAAAAIDATKIADGSVTNAEFQYVGGLTSDAQTQLTNKASLTLPNTFSGTSQTINANDATAAVTLTNASTSGRGISISHTGNGSTGRSMQITQNGTATAVQIDRNHAGANGRFGLALNSRDSGAGAGSITGQAIGSGALGAGCRGHLTDASITRTGTTSTSITITGLSQTLDLTVGYSVSGSGIQAGSTIASIIDATSITLNLAATASATVSLVFTFAGNGLALFGLNLATGPTAKALAISNHSSGSHVGFNAPANVFTSWAMAYPNAQGAAGQVLINDGSGNLSWVTAATTTVGTEGDIGTLTWVGTTAPSGTITQRYKYTKVGRTVTLSWRIGASVAGLATSSVSFILPADVPVPTNFSNQSNDEWVTISGGAVLSTSSAPLVNGAAAGLYKNTTGGYEIKTYSGTVSVAAQFVSGTITYQVDA